MNSFKMRFFPELACEEKSPFSVCVVPLHLRIVPERRTSKIRTTFSGNETSASGKNNLSSTFEGNFAKKVIRIVNYMGISKRIKNCGRLRDGKIVLQIPGDYMAKDKGFVPTQEKTQTSKRNHANHSDLTKSLCILRSF